MPLWIYKLPPPLTAVVIALFIETIALTGLFLVRRFIVPRLHYGSEVHEAVSGTVQAIGVFYGITVGLIAAGVWSTFANASELASKEATSIVVLYMDVKGYPRPLRDELRADLRRYTVFVLEEAWPAQCEGRGMNLTRGTEIMDEFQTKLYTFDPSTWGQMALHAETLKAYNNLLENRRRRIDAVESGLSPIMWAVIWVGAIISIGVAYFYKIADPKLHAVLVALMGGFLALVLFMITINDRPFFGYACVPPDPFKIILNRIDRPE